LDDSGEASGMMYESEVDILKGGMNRNQSMGEHRKRYRRLRRCIECSRGSPGSNEDVLVDSRSFGMHLDCS
jgi:hypothetical protein